MKPLQLVLSLVAIAAGVLSLVDSPAVARPQRNANDMPPALQPLDLGSLAWLTGTWQGAWGPRIAQQAWTSPSSGLMSGTMQIAEHGKAYVTELFLISESPTGVELRVRHFTAALAPWQGTEPAVMTYAGEEKDGLAFVNAADGQPSRLVFKRLDGEHYVLRSEVAPGQSNAQVSEIVFHRVRPAPAVSHKPGL